MAGSLQFLLKFRLICNLNKSQPAGTFLKYAVFLILLHAVTPYSLELVANVSTAGNAGFESFRFTNSDGLYLAAANFWDGKSNDMSAKSPIFKLSITETSGNTATEGGKSKLQDDVELSLEKSQSMRTQGAHGWDYFESKQGDRLLVVPNYYGCGSSRGPATNKCRSTSIYRWREDKLKFVRMQRLSTAGPGQTDHLVTKTGTYLIVGENFDNKVTIWRYVMKDPKLKKRGNESSRPHFQKIQELTGIQGAGAIAICKVDNSNTFLVASSYHSGSTKKGWATDTPIFRWSPTNLGFIEEPIQWIHGQGVHDVECTNFNGQSYLFLSEDRSNIGSEIESKVMIYKNGKYLVYQRIPTDGAHAAEFFQINENGHKSLWLAIANFGDRLGQRYNSFSTVWRFDSSDSKKFVQVASVASQGATDWEFFHMNATRDHYFLALANEGDVKSSLGQTSHIYRIIVDKKSSHMQARHEEENPVPVHADL